MTFLEAPTHPDQPAPAARRIVRDRDFNWVGRRDVVVRLKVQSRLREPLERDELRPCETAAHLVPLELTLRQHPRSYKPSGCILQTCL